MNGYVTQCLSAIVVDKEKTGVSSKNLIYNWFFWRDFCVCVVYLYFFDVTCGECRVFVNRSAYKWCESFLK